MKNHKLSKLYNIFIRYHKGLDLIIVAQPNLSEQAFLV